MKRRGLSRVVPKLSVLKRNQKDFYILIRLKQRGSCCKNFQHPWNTLSFYLGKKGEISNALKCQIVPCELEMGECYFKGDSISSVHGSWSYCTLDLLY